MMNWFRGFWAWIGRLLSPSNKTPRVVEVEKGVPVVAADEAAIASLIAHPGMQALLNKFRLQRSVLEGQLIKTRHKDIRDVDILQLGLYWLGYMESEIRAATKRVEQKDTRPSTNHERAEFEKIRSAIESIGTTIP